MRARRGRGWGRTRGTVAGRDGARWRCLTGSRSGLIGELLTTPEGQAKLRRLMADPKVARSDEVLKPGIAPKDKPAAKDEPKTSGLRIGGKRGKS